MKVFALDPGPVDTGWVLLVDGKIHSFDKTENNELLEYIEGVTASHCINGIVTVIEMIASYGMPVGAEVFETCVWIGRFKQATFNPDTVRFVYRKDVKMHLCGSAKAKDANVRQALIDKFGKQGTKKKPGPTFGFAGDMWAALAVAVYASKPKERVKVIIRETTRNPRKRPAPDSEPKRRVPLEAVPVARRRA